MGEYHATFPLPPQGLGGVVAVHGQLVRWYRACNADRCGDWSTPSVIGPTNLSYTLRTDAQGHEIGADVAMTTERSNNAGGYDHTWVALEVRLPALLARAGNATATHEGNGYAMPGIGRTADAFEGLSAIVTKACVRVAGVEVHRDNSFQPAAKTGEVAFAVVLRP